MVKEVEIRNTVESVKLGGPFPPYTTDAELGMVTGWVSDNGQLLHVYTNRELKHGYARILYLYYSVVDSEYRKIDYHLLEETEPIFGDTEATVHEFDISSVLTIPRRTTKIRGITEITIDLFTYEANITDCTGTAIYGKKRLSVPYKAQTDASVSLPISTDGWYPIGVVDYRLKYMHVIPDAIVKKGDFIYWINIDPDAAVGSGVYIALKDTINTPNTEGDWRPAIVNDTMKFFTIPPPVSYTSAATIIGANAIISRYAKKEYISNILPRISFKANDDKAALYLVLKLTSLREDSILKLEQGDLVGATYMLDILRNEHDAFSTRKQDIIFTQINSTYTI